MSPLSIWQRCRLVPALTLSLLTLGINSQGPTAPSTGLYFNLNGVVYLPGDTVLITDIGEALDFPSNIDPGSSLVCITTNFNTNCCRNSDGGNVGEWFFPSGTIVPRNRTNPKGDFTRTGFTHQARLNRRNNAMTPLGTYTCVVPDMNNSMNHTATITLALVATPTTLPPHLPTTLPLSPPTTAPPTILPPTTTAPTTLPLSPTTAPTTLPPSPTTTPPTTLPPSPTTAPPTTLPPSPTTTPPTTLPPSPTTAPPTTFPQNPTTALPTILISSPTTTPSFKKAGLLFQLRLSGIFDCIQWRGIDTESKLRDITDLLVQEVEQTCGCGFTSSRERFVCFTPQSPGHVTYRAQVNRTLQTTARQLLTFIQQWVASTQSILIQGVQLDIDRTCEPTISTFNDAECTVDINTEMITTVGSNVGTAVGCTIAIVLVIGIIIGVIIIIIWKRSTKKILQSALEINTNASSKDYDITTNQAYGSVSACEESDNHRLSDVYMEILPQKSRYPIMDKLSESPSHQMQPDTQ